MTGWAAVCRPGKGGYSTGWLTVFLFSPYAHSKKVKKGERENLQRKIAQNVTECVCERERQEKGEKKKQELKQEVEVFVFISL